MAPVAQSHLSVTSASGQTDAIIGAGVVCTRDANACSDRGAITLESLTNRFRIAGDRSVDLAETTRVEHQRLHRSHRDRGRRRRGGGDTNNYGRDTQILDPLHHLAAPGLRPAALDHAPVLRDWQLAACCPLGDDISARMTQSES